MEQDPSIALWSRAIEALVRAGHRDAGELVALVHYARLDLAPDRRAEPLHHDDAAEVVARATGVDRNEVRQAWMARLVQSLRLGSDWRPPDLPPVASWVEEVLPRTRVSLALGADPPRRIRPAHLAPPWEEFPYEPTSMGWRMGAGEDYLDEWLYFWDGLSTEAREAYLSRHDAPAEWRSWLERPAL